MKGQKSRRIWICLIAAFIGSAAFSVSVLARYDSHRTNFRYLKWKYGRSPQDYAWCLHLMMVDGDLREHMEGKPLSELRQWLPVTGPPKAGSGQAEWLAGMKPEPNITYEQVGDTYLGIELEGGKVKRFFPMKG